MLLVRTRIGQSRLPNVRSDFDDDRHGIDVAMREIAPGEEIIDYQVVEGAHPYDPDRQEHGR